MSPNTTDPQERKKWSIASPEFAPLEAETKKTFDTLWNQPVEKIRASFSETPPSFADYVPTATDLTITHDTAAVSDGTGVEVRIYRSSKTPLKDAPLFFVTHGGGWTIGNHDIEEAQNRMVAGGTKALVVSVNYRLAPEFPYPYAINDSFDALKWCISNANTLGIDPTKIVIGGGSSGGNIAAALAQKSRDEGLPNGATIIGQVLNIPVTCHPKHFPTEKYEFESYEQHIDAPIVSGKLMYWFWGNYLPNEEPEAYASPLLAKSFTNLPPALIQVAGMDPLRDEGIAYAQALENANISVKLKIYSGLPHAFYMFPNLEATKEYLDEVVGFVGGLIGE